AFIRGVVMNSPVRSLSRKVLGAAQRRFSSARPGSILILVVALLVLVALIGTAALSTNTIDRYATQQNSNNTQVDLLLEGVKNMAKSVIAGDLRDTALSPAQFRPADGYAITYDDSDMPLMVDPGSLATGTYYDVLDVQQQQHLLRSNDAWLSPRTPDLRDIIDLNGNVIPLSANNPPVWSAIGAPLEYPNGIPPAGGNLF